MNSVRQPLSLCTCHHHQGEEACGTYPRVFRNWFLSLWMDTGLRCWGICFKQQLWAVLETSLSSRESTEEPEGKTAFSKQSLWAFIVSASLAAPSQAGLRTSFSNKETEARGGEATHPQAPCPLLEDFNHTESNLLPLLPPPRTCSRDPCLGASFRFLRLRSRRPARPLCT